MPKGIKAQWKLNFGYFDANFRSEFVGELRSSTNSQFEKK